LVDKIIAVIHHINICYSAGQKYRQRHRIIERSLGRCTSINLADGYARRIKNLDNAVSRIRHINISAGIGRYTLRVRKQYGGTASPLS